MRPALPCLLAILALIGFFHVEATAEPATTAVPRLVGLRVLQLFIYFWLFGRWRFGSSFVRLVGR